MPELKPNCAFQTQTENTTLNHPSTAEDLMRSQSDVFPNPQSLSATHVPVDINWVCRYPISCFLWLTLSALFCTVRAFQRYFPTCLLANFVHHHNSSNWNTGKTDKEKPGSQSSFSSLWQCLRQVLILTGVSSPKVLFIGHCSVVETVMRTKKHFYEAMSFFTLSITAQLPQTTQALFFHQSGSKQLLIEEMSSRGRTSAVLILQSIFISLQPSLRKDT